MKNNIIYTLLCVAFLFCFTACNKPTNKDKEIQEKIVGKWISVKNNGIDALTNERQIQTYFSDGNCTVSISQSDIWLNKIEWKYSVDNGRILRNTTDNSDIQVLHVESITDEAVVYSAMESVVYPQLASTSPMEFARVDVDFSTAILGTWEGVSFEGEETHGDANHRWEYKADGTFIYYEKDDDEWIPSTDLMNAYFVDGNYLATLWKETVEETNREWWDIETCDATTMVWTALRQRENGTRYTQKFVLKKVN